jgi:hypothetical protein
LAARRCHIECLLLAQSGPRKALCRGVLPTACVKNVQLTPSPPHPTPPHQSPPASRSAVTLPHRPCGRGRLGPGQNRALRQLAVAAGTRGWCWICEGARCAWGSPLHRLRRSPSPASGRGSVVALFCFDPSPAKRGEDLLWRDLAPRGALPLAGERDHATRGGGGAADVDAGPTC